jgi:hypothetical protein
MNAALYYWRATRGRHWRRTVVVALVCGLLGTVALGAVAGARRTDTAYGRYLASINASDVFVNVPGPVLASIRQIERLPGVASGAAWLGLAAMSDFGYSARRAVVVLDTAAQVAGPRAPMTAMASPARASRARPPAV